MNQTFNTLSLKALFRYPFQGKEWGRKLLYLGLFWLGGLIIPVVPWLFALGYFAEIMRRVANGEADLGLPDWTDWNRLLMDGLRVFGATLVISLPTVVIYMIGSTVYFGTTFSSIAMSQMGQNGLYMLTLFGGMMVFFCSMAVGMFLSVGLGIISAPALAHMVMEQKFAALFHITNWWRVLRANLGGFMIAYFILVGLYISYSFVSYFISLTVVLCGLLPVLWAVSAPYLSVICGVVFGQAYREGLDTLAVDTAEEIPSVGV